MSTDEKSIGRRTFLGLVVAGILALFLGRDVFPRLTTGGSSGPTTPGGGPAGTTSGGRSPTAGFRINSVKAGPTFDLAAWGLAFEGLVAAPFRLTYPEFTALAQTTMVRDFYCVEGWGVNGVEWVGVRVKELMDRAQIQTAATHLVFHSGDGVYADSLTLEQAAEDDVLLAHRVNGIALPSDMGEPLRLVTPGRYGYKYVKWVERVEAIDRRETPFTGYWQQFGYSEHAVIP